MSNLVKWIIGSFAWLVLTLSSYYYGKPAICNSWLFGNHQHQQITKNNNTPVATPPPSNTQRSPIDFSASDATPLLNDGFETLKEELLTEADNDLTLVITGLYSEKEKNTSTLVNLGLARAIEMKKILGIDIEPHRIRTKAEKIINNQFTPNTFFEAIKFNWIKEEKKTVERFPDRTIIRFPFNSVEKITDSNIDAYLEELANRIKESEEKISLTGHTDDVGEAEINVQLALRRAKMIRDILIKKGVNRNQIKTYSKGENEPIAANDTEAGRKENRRVVVRLIGKNK